MHGVTREITRHPHLFKLSILPENFALPQDTQLRVVRRNSQQGDSAMITESEFHGDSSARQLLLCTSNIGMRSRVGGHSAPSAPLPVSAAPL